MFCVCVGMLLRFDLDEAGQICKGHQYTVVYQFWYQLVKGFPLIFATRALQCVICDKGNYHEL